MVVSEVDLTYVDSFKNGWLAACGYMILKSSENVRKFHYLYFVIRHYHPAQLKKCGRGSLRLPW